MFINTYTQYQNKMDVTGIRNNQINAFIFSLTLVPFRYQSVIA